MKNLNRPVINTIIHYPQIMMSGINLLPTEILHIIILYLDHADQYNFLFVCQRFRAIIYALTKPVYVEPSMILLKKSGLTKLMTNRYLSDQYLEQKDLWSCCLIGRTLNDRFVGSVDFYAQYVSTTETHTIYGKCRFNYIEGSAVLAGRTTVRVLTVSNHEPFPDKVELTVCLDNSIRTDYIKEAIDRHKDINYAKFTDLIHHYKTSVVHFGLPEYPEIKEDTRSQEHINQHNMMVARCYYLGFLDVPHYELIRRTIILKATSDDVYRSLEPLKERRYNTNQGYYQFLVDPDHPRALLIEEEVFDICHLFVLIRKITNDFDLKYIPS